MKKPLEDDETKPDLINFYKNINETWGKREREVRNEDTFCPSLRGKEAKTFG